MALTRSFQSIFKIIRSRLWRRQISLSWTGVGAIVALCLSVVTAYFQFWPRYHVTATVIAMSARPEIGQSGDTLRVHVEVALWNQGNRPGVISQAVLLFSACPDWWSARRGTPIHAFSPFVLAPHDTVLKTIEADISPAELRAVQGKLILKFFLKPHHDVQLVPYSLQEGVTSDLTLGRARCNSNVKTSKDAFYVFVALKAMQSDAKLGMSVGLGGVLGSTVPLTRAAVGGFGLLAYTPFPPKHLPVAAISVIPGQYPLASGQYFYSPVTGAR